LHRIGAAYHRYASLLNTANLTAPDHRHGAHQSDTVYFQPHKSMAWQTSHRTKFFAARPAKYSGTQEIAIQ
jgi:hypothetical protein